MVIYPWYMIFIILTLTAVIELDTISIRKNVIDYIDTDRLKLAFDVCYEKAEMPAGEEGKTKNKFDAISQH